MAWQGPGSTQRLVGGLGPGPACASRRLRVWAAAFGGCSCRGARVSGAARAGLSAPARAAPAGLARGPRWAGGASLNEDVPGDAPAPSPPPFLQGGPGRHSARAARGMCLSCACAAAGQALHVTRPAHTGPRRPQDGLPTALPRPGVPSGGCRLGLGPERGPWMWGCGRPCLPPLQQTSAWQGASCLRRPAHPLPAFVGAKSLSPPAAGQAFALSGDLPHHGSPCARPQLD